MTLSKLQFELTRTFRERFAMRDDGFYTGFDKVEFTNWIQDFLLEDDWVLFHNPSLSQYLLLLGHFAKWRTSDQKYMADAVFVSKDGKTFYQMVEDSSMRAKASYDVKRMRFFEEPTTKTYSYLDMDDDRCSWFKFASKEDSLISKGGTHWHLDKVKINLQNAIFVPVPEIREVVGLYRLPDGSYTYIDEVQHKHPQYYPRLFTVTSDGKTQVNVIKRTIISFQEVVFRVTVTDKGVLYETVRETIWTTDTEPDYLAFVEHRLEGISLTKLDHKLPKFSNMLYSLAVS